jgi:ATP-dependent RNA helicase DDX46/PRP5
MYDINRTLFMQRRPRDRDDRRNRSIERYDRRGDDTYRRDRDRERHRSRDRRRSRSPRGGRRRSRDYRDRRSPSRERDTRDRNDSKPSEPVNIEAAKAAEEEKKKADRVAKLEAWKAKQAAEREKKLKENQASGGARSILADMDRKALASPQIGSPASPSTPTTSTPPVGTKFDHKAITKKIIAAPTAALGGDIIVPAKNSANAKPALPLSKSAKATAFKASGNLSGFGLGGKQTEVERKRLAFEDEVSSKRKLEKLPTPPAGEDEDVEMTNGAEEADDDDDEDFAVGDTEEEALAAARAAAEKREERLQDVQDTAEEEVEDVQMIEAPQADEVEEVDELDAFMAGLDQTNKPKRKQTTISRKKAVDPEAFWDEDEVPGQDSDLDDGNPDDILAMATKKRKREIPTVDHSKVKYDDFRKNFYAEPTELAEMTEEDVKDLRLELDGIQVRGVNIPKPVLKWSQCGLGVATLDVIRSLGYEKPTSIQSQAIPAIMSGRDVIGVAKTGSGKTISYLLPMFRHIRDQKPLEGLDGPIGLILAPTRELAAQIYKECKPFLKALTLKAVCAYGGAPIKDQIADLKRGAEIVVCTPGRMIELLSANSGRVTNLRRVTYVVLDEADRMFDMGFEPQVMKILANVRPERQTVLLSATFPRQMEALARKTLNKPIEIIVGGRSVVAPEITQIVEVREEGSKFIRLLQLLGELYNDEENEDARTLIFMDRQKSADDLLTELMRKGYPCNSIHGGKDQVDRDSTIDDFKAGVIPILIATSVAARGLDVKQLKLVINYDCPNHLEDYVHRAGRTGRAGNKGTAVTFITPDQERYAANIVKALKWSSQPIPEDVQKLADGFTEMVKSGKAKFSASGFGGKGLEKLDLERDAARNIWGKAFKTGDEPEEAEKTVVEIDDEDFMINTAPATSNNFLPKGLDENNIVVHKAEPPPDTGGVKRGPGNALDKVRAAVASIGDRLNKRNQLNPGHPIDNKGPDAGAFHSTLEINDFPQKARWGVTNRTNVAKILDATGTSITTKGNYYTNGKEPGPNDAPKLYILVEGDTEVQVRNAMRELYRLLKEGTVAAADQESRAPTGKYNVV